ncbi:MAG: D-2-hydroxyacid dehydrogenase [Candidatus Binataceae bacterium]
MQYPNRRARDAFDDRFTLGCAQVATIRLDGKSAGVQESHHWIMRIISTVALTATQERIIADAAGGAELAHRTCRANEDFEQLLATGADVLLTFRVPDDVIERTPGLKWIQLLSAGADHTPQKLIASGTVPLTTASGIHATPIAEYTIASMLAFAHKLHVSIRAQMRREWLRSGQFMASVDEVRGKTLGVIGYGSIGRETARIADALGMRVLALKRDSDAHADPGWCPAGVGDPDGRIPAKWYGPGERDAVMRESDYLTVTLPSTPLTRHFIGPNEIAAMRPGAYIVNIGRGDVIDEPALIAALSEKKIGGAGLDVFEKEPLARESPLWELESAILTPHMSGASRSYVDKACELFADNLRRFRAGRPLLNQVDPQHGY